MEPYEEFHYILQRLIAPYGYWSGLHIFNRDNSIPIVRRIFTVFFGLSYPILYFYAIVDFEGQTGVQAIAFMGIGIQVSEQ